MVPLKDNVALALHRLILAQSILFAVCTYIQSIEKHCGITLKLLYNKNAQSVSIN